ncbi:MAG: carboxypeptidase regulatory-like domain-containing protein [Desulfuromonadaceae bacterium]
MGQADLSAVIRNSLFRKCSIAFLSVLIFSLLSTTVFAEGISGKVSDSAGIGIAGVLIFARDAASGSLIGAAPSQSDGTYTISGLPTGSYKLQFNGGSTGYISQWYNNKTSLTLADVVTVTAGVDTNGINATLILGGTISGKVSNSADTGAAGVLVRVYDAASGSYISYGYSQFDGSYTSPLLSAGSYKLQFIGGSTGYISQWYNNKTSPSLADAVTVTAGTATSGINATLILGGTISGKVSNSAGTGIAGITVQAYDVVSSTPFNSTFSQSDGSYIITGLPAASYNLRFSGGNTGYISQWYDSKTSQMLAGTVSISAGITTTGINATMILGGTISGKVSNSAGSGIAGVYLRAYEVASSSNINYGSSQSDGSYTITGLPTGSYKLEFSGGSTGYISQWYNNKTSQALADAVTVTAGAATSDINATLILGGTITGKVSNTEGTGISGVSVQVYDATSGYPNSASSLSDGSYTIAGLLTGSYKLHFGGSGYLNQWYSSKTLQVLADTVSVTAGGATSGIDATLVLGSTIAGKVSDTAGTGLAGVSVRVYDAVSGYPLYNNSASSQSDGSYTITGLPTGSYKLQFSRGSTGYISHWYNDKTSQTLADAVTVTAGATTSGINATLILGGTISGKVSNSAGGNIAGVSVQAYDATSGSSYNSASSQSDGSYTITGLPTGSYKLQFSGGSNGYLSQWYNNNTSQALADAVSVTAGAATSVINATLILGGTISGKISNSAGVGIAGVDVSAYDAVSGSYISYGSSQLDGSYTITGLPTGSYKLQFSGGSNGYLSQWYNNKTSQALADAVTVTAGATTNDINATLILGGTISGKVSNLAGAGIAGILIQVGYSESVSCSSVTSCTAIGTVYRVSSQSDGSYSITGLPTGSYKLQFGGDKTGYISQWYNNNTSQTLADSVTVSAGITTTGINATMNLGGTISGKVSNSIGIGIAGVSIQAYDAVSGSFYNSTSSQSDGSYTISGLPTGSYKLQFSGGRTGYLSQWFNSKISQTLADAVTVTAGAATSDINATLILGGTISGKISNSIGTGIAGVSVNVSVYSQTSSNVTTSVSYYISSQSDGSYTITGLPAGSHKLQFGGGNTGYISQWYNNKTSETLADAVTVTTGAATSDINATLILGGTISGKISNSAGVGIAGVYVYLYDAASSSGFNINGVSSQSDGTYTITGLSTGSYKLLFSGGSTGYISQWYNNKTTQTLADAVTVTAGTSTSGINATLILGGTISGKVSNSAGTGIAGVLIQVFDFNEVSNVYGTFSGYIYSVVSQPDGSYTITGLSTGSYKLQFNGGSTGYISQWYNNKTSRTLADAVTVTAGTTTSGINATLIQGSTISGTVSNSAGVGIAGVYVWAYDAASGSNSNYASSQSDGSYTITGLPTGSYKLQFNGGRTGYLSQWFNNKISQTLADAVTVTAGAVTSGINATLILGGTISGKVRNSSGTGIAGVSIQVYDSDSISYAYVTPSTYYNVSSQSDGSYTITGLPTGSYKLQFSEYSIGYLSQWYTNKTSQTLADPVTVTAGTATSDINATLVLGGTITGKVINSTGVGIAGVYVLAHDTSTGFSISGASSQSDGSYTITKLPTGSYKLEYDGGSTGYLSQWHNNKTSQAMAEAIAVTAGNTTPGINTTLTIGGIISGTVTDLSGVGISGISVVVFDLATNSSISWATTNSGGNYTIIGLPTGNYAVRFNSTASSNNYVSAWSNNKPGISTADTVSVVAGKTTDGVNAVLASGGTISGQLTEGTAGVEGITVYAYNSFDETVAYAVTDVNGNYSIKGLPDGGYRLGFQEGALYTEHGFFFYYGTIGYVYQVYTNPNINTIYVSKGTLIPVTSTNPVTGINAVLVKGMGSISGTITDVASGAVLPNVTVRVVDLNGGFIGGATSSHTDGTYSVKGIPTGSYKVEFTRPGGLSAHQWYAAKGSFAAATTVVVTAPGNTPSINAALGTGPSIQLPSVINEYGTVAVNSTSTKVVSVYNYGTADLIVGLLSITGTEFHLLNDRCSGKTLPPSSSCTIQVSFTPTVAGSKSETVNIPSNDPETATTGIVVKGTAVALLTYPLNVTLSGSGSVNSDPAGIACTSVVCTKMYDSGVWVKLMATAANNYSTFTGWTGACTNITGDCTMIMDNTKDVTATFTANPATVKIDGDTVPYYTIDSALDAITTEGKTVRARADIFIENVIMTSPVLIDLKGGYTDSSFNTRTSTSTTVIDGSLKIRRGTLRIERLVVR